MGCLFFFADSAVDIALYFLKWFFVAVPVHRYTRSPIQYDRIVFFYHIILLYSFDDSNRLPPKGCSPPLGVDKVCNLKRQMIRYTVISKRTKRWKHAKKAENVNVFFRSWVKVAMA